MQLIKVESYLNAIIAENLAMWIFFFFFQKARDQANFHEKNRKENDGNEDKLFITCLAANVEYNDDIWYLDSRLVNGTR